MPIYTSDLNSSGIIYADTITTNSNEDITLNPAGTGQVVVDSNLNLTDNNYLYIGTGNDLRIYHTGTNSHIEDWGDGDLYIKASNNAFFQGKNSNHVIQQWGDFGGNGFTKLRYGNVEVFETVSGGVAVTGNLAVDSITSNDSSALSFNTPIHVNTISSADSTAIQIDDSLNISGTLSANTIDVNTLTSGDSSGININDTALYVNGDRVSTITGTETLENKTLRAPTFESGSNAPEFLETRYVNATQQDFVQLYTGASSGSYFTQGEYQKICTITPDSDSQNYTFRIRMTATSASNYQIVEFTGALRSNTLPDLDFTSNYFEEHNGTRFIEPKLWTKETTTAGFILAFEYVHNANLYGGVNVEATIIPRSDAQRANVVFNTTQNSEQSSIDTGFTERDPTLIYANVSGTLEFGTQFRIEGSSADDNELTITATNPTADRTITFPDASGTVALTSDITGGTLTLGDSSSNSGTVVVGTNDLEFRSGNSVTATVSGNGVTYALNDAIVVNEISSDDSTAIQINDSINVSGDITTAGTVEMDRLSLSSNQTTVSPLQLTANSLQDGVGALRIDGAQADIFLNPSTATHTTVTFAVNGDQRLAFGMDNASDFYITRRTGGSWYDDTFVIDRDTGELRYGYDVSISGSLSVNTIASSDSTAIQINDGLNVSGTVSADTIDVNTISSSDSSAIRINDGISMAGSIIPASNDTYDLGSSTSQWRDLYVGPGSIYVNGKKVIEDSSGTITVSTDADQNLNITTSGTGQTTLQSVAGLNFTTTSSGDITLTTDTGNIELKGNVEVLTGKQISDSANTQILIGNNFAMQSNKITGLGTPTADGDASTKAYVDQQVSGVGTTLGISDSSSNTGSVTVATNDLEFRSGDSITATVAGTGVTFDLNENITVNEISSSDSSAVQLNDAVNVSGVITANASGNSLFVADTLRIAQSGSGLRMTNVGAFDNDGSDNFRIFSTNDLIFSAGGDSNTALTVDGTTRDITINNNLEVTGNLTVSGTTTYVDTTNLTVSDPLIILSKGNSGGSDVDAGIMVERGSAGNNAVFYWNEGEDKFKAVTSTSGHDATAITDSATATIVADLEGDVTASSITVNEISANDSTSVSIQSPVQLDSTLQVAGNSTINGNVNLGDNNKLQLGASQDLAIYHDGSQSIIEDVGTGQLKILAENTLHFGSATGTETYIRALKNGAVELYHDSSKKFSTTNTGSITYGDAEVQGSVITDTITTTGSNDDITISANGTGRVVIGSELVTNKISSDDSTQVEIQDGLYIQGSTTVGGIGRTGDAKLSVSHTAADVVSIIRENASGSAQIRLGNTAGYVRLGGNGGDFSVYTSSNTTARLYIDTSGNVGIGNNTSPAYTLDVAGDIRATGSIITDTITTDGSNSDINISANGTGDVVIGSDLAVNQIKSDDSTNIRVADNLVPAADDTYSLGTPDRKWSALYVTGSTIFMDDTKLQVDGSGDFTVKDASNNLKRVVASEVEIGSGSNKIKIQRGTNGRVKFTDENDTPTSVLQIVGDDSTGVSLNTNETIKIAGGNGIQTAVSGDTLTITGSTGGFTNSTETSFPITDDSTATDFSDDEPEGLGTAASGTDAFGVAISGVYDCMEPVGNILTTDLAGSESYVGA